jgi:hypothetical protein
MLMPTVAETSGVLEQSKLCVHCGHPEYDHLMHAELPYPTDGWITCPVAGCECYGTWSIDDESRAAMEQHRNEHYRQEAERAKNDLGT